MHTTPLRSSLLLILAFVGCALVEKEPNLDGQASGGGKGDDPSQSGSTDDLAIWSWNLENFPHADDAPERVADILAATAADIVGFQEIDDTDAFDALLMELPGWSGFPGLTGFGTQVAIAYRRAKVKVIDIEDLFTDDSSAFPRPALAVTFEVRSAPELGPLTVVVVHLKAQVDEASEDRRRDAIEKLELWIYQRRLAGKAAVLALGDYNDEIGDLRADNVFLPFLDRDENYVPLTLDLDEADEYSYIPFRRLIDHSISTREAAERFPKISVEALALEGEVAGYLKDISDHRPVRTIHALQ